MPGRFAVQKKAKGIDPIFLRGEIEAEKELLARTQGSELDSELAGTIKHLLDENGLTDRIAGY